jgi:hypothetical protein
MKIRIQPKGLKQPQIFEDVQSIVVYDEHGHPMYVGQQVSKDVCIQEKAGYGGFEKLLEALGIGLSVPYKVIN